MDFVQILTCCCKNIMYKIEYTMEKKYLDPACTSVLCAWIQSTKKEIEPKMINNRYHEKTENQREGKSMYSNHFWQHTRKLQMSQFHSFIKIRNRFHQNLLFLSAYQKT